jgi:uncharacterized protein (UPF0333 family)
MNSTEQVILIVVIVIVIALIYFKNKKEGFETTTSPAPPAPPAPVAKTTAEAIATVASLYNTGNFTVTDLNVTNSVNVGNGLNVNNKNGNTKIIGGDTGAKYEFDLGGLRLIQPMKDASGKLTGKMNKWYIHLPEKENKLVITSSLPDGKYNWDNAIEFMQDGTINFNAPVNFKKDATFNKGAAFNEGFVANKSSTVSGDFITKGTLHVQGTDNYNRIVLGRLTDAPGTTQMMFFPGNLYGGRMNLVVNDGKGGWNWGSQNAYQYY